jgi:hypothetical protein
MSWLFIYLKDNILLLCAITINVKGKGNNSLCHNISSINSTCLINLVYESQPFNKSLFANFGYSMNLHLPIYHWINLRSPILPLNRSPFTTPLVVEQMAIANPHHWLEIGLSVHCWMGSIIGLYTLWIFLQSYSPQELFKAYKWGVFCHQGFNVDFS